MTTTENLKENLVEDEVTNIQLKDEKGFEKETLLVKKFLKKLNK